MKSTRTLQVTVIAFSVILFVLLFIANKKPEAKTENLPGKAGTGSDVPDIKVFADAVISTLPEKDKKEFEALDKNKGDTIGINALVDFFNRKKLAVPSCYYFQKKAEKANTDRLWFEAGNRYFYAVGFVKDNIQQKSLFASAIACFTKALEKNPANVEAKIQLASCYVEGSTDPMKGIGMLKEVENKDTANIRVQMVLGAFAVKSGQLEKAETRYKKVIRLNPGYLEAYLFLADVYEKEGEKSKTIETLEKYVGLTPDKEIKDQIKKYIQQLKTNV